MKILSGGSSSSDSGAAVLGQNVDELHTGAQQDYSAPSGAGAHGEQLASAHQHAQDHINSEHGSNR
jgi:hypothetical protein